MLQKLLFHPKTSRSKQMLQKPPCFIQKSPEATKCFKTPCFLQQKAQLLQQGDPACFWHRRGLSASTSGVGASDRLEASEEIWASEFGGLGFRV